jgi:hypothetical protein
MKADATPLTKPKIVFIASLGHSGSTLLDLMLNAHPDMASVGELKQLTRYTRFQRGRGRTPRCSCGAESLGKCDFWREVDDITVKHGGRHLGDLNVEDYADAETFQRDNTLLFGAIAAAAGKKIIVDSSKQIERLALLVENPELDVFPVFLVRDPKGQICSSLRKNGKQHKLGKGHNSLLRLISNYSFTNRRIYSVVKHRPHAVVHYEHLAKDPQGTLSALMAAIGMNFDPQQLKFVEQERHNISGNRMRFAASSRIRLDERWRQSLTFPQRLMIMAGTLPGRYPFVKFSLGGRSSTLSEPGS